MWTDLRQEIEQARQALGLSERDFAPLPYTTDWRQLEETLYRTFCVLDHPTNRPRWLWDAFKPGAYALSNEEAPLATLLTLVDEEEQVWLMVNDAEDKFWFYQGRREAVRVVLNECYHLDEIYLLSKKYEWLLCLNHHDVLYGVGTPMRERLQARAARPVIYRDAIR